MDAMTYQTADGLEIELRIPAGTINLSALDTTETRVELTGERSPDDVSVRFTPRPTGGHRLVIEHRPRKSGWFGGVNEVRVEIRVPLGTDVDAGSASADLVAHGSLGSLVFRTGSGDATFDDVRGNAVLKVASGDVHGNSVYGDFSFHSASGDVRVGRVGGASHITTISGDARVDATVGSVRATTISGDFRVATASAGELNVKTVSGDIEIGVAPGTRVWLDLGSRTGDTVSELDQAGGDDGARLEIRATSVSGDIRVTRSGLVAAR